MLNSCVYSVNNLLVDGDILCVQHSTDFIDRCIKVYINWVQVLSNTKVVQQFRELLPTGFLSGLYLLYTNLYSQSTEPIINNQKGNLKKGNKQWN